jgi:nucleotide-binding universal stress UspA family protein
VSLSYRTKQKERAMLPIRNILHPTDFSASSDCALRLACSLAREQSAQLTVLHVVHASLAAEKRGFGEELGEELNRMKIPDAQIRAERRLEEGDPVTQILRVAGEENCDLIVIGTHGRTGLGRLLMGSVAEQVVRKATCSVLTVKTPQCRVSSSEELASAAAGEEAETTV